MSARHVLTVLAVTDLSRSVSFYTRAFGWTVGVDVPGVYVELRLPDGMGLGLYERSAFAQNTGVVPQPLAAGQIAGAELYLYVDDVRSSCAALRQVGAMELSAPAKRPWGDEAAYFRDPDGVVVVVATPPAGED